MCVPMRVFAHPCAFGVCMHVCMYVCGLKQLRLVCLCVCVCDCQKPHYSHNEDYHSESSRGSDLSDIMEEDEEELYSEMQLEEGRRRNSHNTPKVQFFALILNQGVRTTQINYYSVNCTGTDTSIKTAAFDLYLMCC